MPSELWYVEEVHDGVIYARSAGDRFTEYLIPMRSVEEQDRSMIEPGAELYLSRSGVRVLRRPGRTPEEMKVILENAKRLKRAFGGPSIVAIICSVCRRQIREEVWPTRQSSSHGLCPECALSRYGIRVETEECEHPENQTDWIHEDDLHIEALSCAECRKLVGRQTVRAEWCAGCREEAEDARDRS